MIRKRSDAFKGAMLDLSKYQRGELKPSKSRYSSFNEVTLGGTRPGHINILAGASGAGKSYLAQQRRQDFLSISLNPHSKDSILLECQWEMPPLSQLLRELKGYLDLPMREMLSREFTDMEKVMAQQWREEMLDVRAFVDHEASTPEKWEDDVQKFLEQHCNANHVEVQIDHAALISDKTSKGKKDAMDKLVEACNRLKLTYTNSSFTILSQLNRDIDNRRDARDAAPRRSDLYGSDTMYHIADIVMVLDNPYLRGIDKYMVVNPDRWDYQDYLCYMENPDAQYTNFTTKGLLFHHYLKVRDIDDMEKIKRLDVIELYPRESSKEETSYGRIEERGDMDIFE